MHLRFELDLPTLTGYGLAILLIVVVLLAKGKVKHLIRLFDPWIRGSRKK